MKTSKLGKLDKVIIFLPVLGVLDVFSTFLAGWRGLPISLYETGLFASYFAQKGLLNLYVFIYFGILLGMATVFLYIKLEVSSDGFLDRLLLLLLVAAICIIEAFMAGVIMSNFLIGLGRPIPISPVRWLTYLSVLVAILAYVWDELRELFGFGSFGGS